MQAVPAVQSVYVDLGGRTITHGFLTSAEAGIQVLPHLGSDLLSLLCGNVGAMCNV
jgi:hypothetical protein